MPAEQKRTLVQSVIDELQRQNPEISPAVLRKTVYHIANIGSAPSENFDEMATVYPVSLEELQQVQGVGAGKARKFGKEFVELIKRHCEENDIERPEDLRVRTVAKKSAVKVKIIQSIDRQVALDDIANAQGLEFEELLDEVEAIVYSGTKLNIDYFLEEVMDDDHVDDIYDYFSESDTDDLATAMEELGDDYSEDEVRLVRIKFLSEVAN